MTKRGVGILLLLVALATGAHAAPAAKRAITRPAMADSASVVAMLGGVTNGACPYEGVATGGQPSEAHLVSLAKAGYTTVLDLRMPDEPRGMDEPAVARRAGLAYESLPFVAGTLDDAVFTRFRTIMRTRGKGVFVHCASANRVNAVLVPWLVLDRGWTPERAFAVARANGLRSPEMEARARDYVARQSVKH
jgi:protein tyrosine phosphatase (PTP) superfamily phosphohydrolase (DUF442 family)